APPAGDERLGAQLCLRPAFQAQASARRAQALPAAAEGCPRLVDAAARRGGILLPAGARHRSLVRQESLPRIPGNRSHADQLLPAVEQLVELGQVVPEAVVSEPVDSLGNALHDVDALLDAVNAPERRIGAGARPRFGLDRHRGAALVADLQQQSCALADPYFPALARRAGIIVGGA